jgi:thiol-disulfide isomerase/thioredoxin
MRSHRDRPGDPRHQETTTSIEGELVSLDSATGWLNSNPLSAAGLRGNVVLVQFWTYTCINWLRTLPYVRAWVEKYEGQGLVVIGAHTPEFPVEHDRQNVRRAATHLMVDYPIAIDNDYEIWNGFGNQYWPALYLVDAQGQIRYHHFGEGAYDETERALQLALTNAGAHHVDDALVEVDARGVEAPADWDTLQSPESYLGYGRAESFVSPGRPAFDERHVYTAPERLRLNQWALSGDWTIGQQAAVLNEPNGRIADRFHARDLHLVMGPGAREVPVPIRVRLDGLPPGDAHGLDVDDQGNGTVTEPRMYQLIRQPAPIADRLFEIEFPDPGVEAFVFTFG